MGTDTPATPACPDCGRHEWRRERQAEGHLVITDISRHVLDEEDPPGGEDDDFDWFRCVQCDDDIAGDDEQAALELLLRDGYFGARPEQLWPWSQR